MRERAVPQLNRAEQEEMREFLIWVMAGDTNVLKVLSATVYAVADSLRQAGLHLRAEGDRRYESEPVVRFVKQEQSIGGFLDQRELEDPLNLRRGLKDRAQQISYPRGQPETMIDTISLPRSVTNRIEMFWKLGAKAAERMELVPLAGWPFTPESDIEYVLENSDLVRSKFAIELTMLANHGFPVASQSIMLALEELAKGVDSHRLEWLHLHTALEFLQRETLTPSRRPENMELWVQYQALVFGFYYRLLKSLVALELVQQDAYFRGIWGYGSTAFLAMCTQFADGLRSHNQVSRTHILYLLSTMHNGRRKGFSYKSPGSGLLGILGTISVLTMPLLRTSDVPDEIAKFAVVDLPVIDLMSESSGELYSGTELGIEFVHAAKAPKEISPRRPSKEWSVHAKMGMMFGEGRTGVVMAARCSGRLVGWFSPLAADVTFLSSAYQVKRHETEVNYVDESVVKGFEVTDEDWQNGQIQRPLPEDLVDQIGVVHSRGCAALHYAASGFYASAREEVAIASDDINVAVGRVEGQGSGLVIA